MGYNKGRIERLEKRAKRQVERYLSSLSDEELLELAREVLRKKAAEDLGIAPEEVTDEQLGIWARENGLVQDGPGAIEPSFDCD